jgi:hypothetical protein
MRRGINRPVLDLSARRILAEEVIAFPVLRWPDRPGYKPTATVRAHIAQDTVNTRDAERTLVSANARFE